MSVARVLCSKQRILAANHSNVLCLVECYLERASECEVSYMRWRRRHNRYAYDKLVCPQVAIEAMPPPRQYHGYRH